MAFKYRTQQDIQHSQETFANTPEWLKKDNSFSRFFAKLNPQLYGEHKGPLNIIMPILVIAALILIFTPFWYISFGLGFIFSLSLYADMKGPYIDLFHYIWIPAVFLIIIRLLLVYAIYPFLH